MDEPEVPKQTPKLVSGVFEIAKDIEENIES